jgi:KUP system potassium uptake protein
MGIAVTGAMMIDNFLLAVMLFVVWKWAKWLAIPLLVIFTLLDFGYLAANLTKIPDGGCAAGHGMAIFTLLTTWSKGRALMRQHGRRYDPVRGFRQARPFQRPRAWRARRSSCPRRRASALLHNIKHNKVLHERVVVLTVLIEDVRYWRKASGRGSDFGQGFYKGDLRSASWRKPMCLRR